MVRNPTVPLCDSVFLTAEVVRVDYFTRRRCEACSGLTDYFLSELERSASIDRLNLPIGQKRKDTRTGGSE